MVISLCITNEKLWNQGLFYRGIHIGTKDDEITSDYDWWTYGRFEVDGGRWVKTNAAPVHTSISNVHVQFARGLIRATLRNVKERVKPVLAEEVQGRYRKEQSHFRFTKYCLQATSRCIKKYGRDSEMFRMLTIERYLMGNREACRRALQRHWAPPWETMMHLDQDRQELDLQLPPRTLRRRRLLRPRTSSNPAATTPGPGPAKYRMRSIFFDDAASEEESVGSETKRRATHHPAVPRPWAQNYRLRSIFFPISPSRRAVKSSIKKHGAKLRRRTSPQPCSSRFRMKSILSLDIPPEPEAVDAETETPVVAPVPRPMPSRRQTPKYRMESNLSPLDTASENSTVSSEEGKVVSGQVFVLPKTPRPQTPAHEPGTLLSALGFTAELAAVSSESEERGACPVSRRRRRRNRNRGRKECASQASF